MTKTENNNSSFIFGLVIGAVIAAVVAVYIYKNQKSVVFQNLKDKLEKYFSDFCPAPKKATSKKISVDIPATVESIDITPPVVKRTQKMFKK